MNVNLWTINETTTLLENRRVQKRIRSIFRGKCCFRTRRFQKEDLRNLMPDAEYFIPVPIKCIGGKFDEMEGLDPEGKALLQGIKDYYFTENNGKPYQEFWKGVTINDYHQQMYTDSYKGYYQLIEEATAQEEHNIILGYSQGGLIAKFLAFLDRYVFKKNLIDGIIIVGAPVTGSPLANPSNGEFIVDGAIELFFSFISFYKKYPHVEGMPGKDYPGFDDLLGYVTEKINYHHLIDFLKMVGKDAKELGPFNKEFNTLYHGVKTFESWLSGLNNDVNSAFFDLNINRLRDPFSVLSLINNEKYRLDGVYQAAIVGTDNDVRSFFRSFLIESWGWKMKIFGGFVMALLKVQRMFGFTIYDNLKKASRIFKSIILVENEDSPGEALIEEKLRQYQEGIKELNIPKGAHDFIVPSVYQIVNQEPDEWFLGNFINDSASHSSGCSTILKGGKENVKLIIKCLKEIVRRSF